MKVKALVEKENVWGEFCDWSHKYKVPGEDMNFDEFKINWKLFLLHPFLYPIYAALLVAPFQ